MVFFYRRLNYKTLLHSSHKNKVRVKISSGALGNSLFMFLHLEIDWINMFCVFIWKKLMKKHHIYVHVYL